MLSSGGGVYRLVNIKVDRSYAVRVRTNGWMDGWNDADLFLDNMFDVVGF